MPALYVDASAAVKLIIAEPESSALVEFIRGHAATSPGSRQLVASDLLRTELLAVAGRAGASAQTARRLLGSIHLVSLTAAVCDAAGRLAGSVTGPALGSLDAIHLNTALTVISDVEAILTYDHRLAEVAKHLGLTVVSPK